LKNILRQVLAKILKKEGLTGDFSAKKLQADVKKY
jgi:hypothetical protein